MDKLLVIWLLALLMFTVALFYFLLSFIGMGEAMAFESFSEQSICKLSDTGRPLDNGLYAHEKAARKARAIASKNNQSFITIGEQTRYF